MFADKKVKLLIFFFYSLVLVLLVFSLIKEEKKEPLPKKEIKKKPELVLNEFGFPDDSLIVVQSNVKRNETLSEILMEFNLSMEKISELLSISGNHLDQKKIITGNNYQAFMSNDSLNQIQYFVYEKDPVNYVVFNLVDSIEVFSGKKKVKTERKTISAVINQSLYTAMLKNEASPELVIELSEVFAWQIDFYRIQDGDYFKVIYEEFVNDKPIGIKNILGAYFNHSGEEFYAIPFHQDNTRQFFDENGKSLRKAFLKSPLKYSRISSRYSKKRLHPVQRIYKAHLGTDYAAPTGTPIRSVGDGVVLEASYTRGNGRYIKIRHNNTYATQYLHMSKFAKGIRKGARVKQGEVIGYVGSTGIATGPHLCYRFWKNGVQVDPLKEKIPPSHPVKHDMLNDYIKIKNDVITKLDSIKLSFETRPEISSIVN